MFKKQIKISSKQFDNLINMSNYYNVKLYNVVRDNDDIVFCIDTLDFNKFKVIFKRKKIDFEIIKELSKKQKNILLLSFITCIITFIITISICIINSKICTNYIINCNKDISYEVSQILSDNGVVFPCNKDDYNLEDIKTKILEKINNISFCEIKFSNKKMIINCVYLNEDKNVLEKHSRIVAKKDGIITRIIVLSGTAVVKTGDVVKAGDVLIDGYVLLDNLDMDSKVLTNADGIVYANTFESERLILPEKEIKVVKTGKIYEDTLLKIGEKIIGNEQEKYNDYFVNESIINIQNFKDISIIKRKYYEVKNEIVELSEESINSLINENCVNMWNKLDSGVLIVKSWTIQKKVDILLIIDIYYELEESINFGG